MNNKTVIVEGNFNIDTESVWKALTDKQTMKQWYISVKEFRTLVGFKFDFWGGEEGDRKWKHLCEITEVVPEEKLTYSWQYEGYSGISYVSFELFKIDKGTRLKLTHSGIDTFPPDVSELAIHNFEKGWEQAIHGTLKDFLEK